MTAETIPAEVLAPFRQMAACTEHTDARDGEIVMRLQHPQTREWIVLTRAHFRAILADRSTRPAEPADGCGFSGPVHDAEMCPVCHPKAWRPAEPAPEVEEFAYVVIGRDWKKVVMDYQSAWELTLSIPSTIDTLVRLSTLEAERARADRNAERAEEADRLRVEHAMHADELRRERDEAVRVASGLATAVQAAGWSLEDGDRYSVSLASANRMVDQARHLAARLRADQPVGEGGEA